MRGPFPQHAKDAAAVCDVCAVRCSLRAWVRGALRANARSPMCARCAARVGTRRAARKGPLAGDSWRFQEKKRPRLKSTLMRPHRRQLLLRALRRPRLLAVRLLALRRPWLPTLMRPTLLRPTLMRPTLLRMRPTLLRMRPTLLRMLLRMHPAFLRWDAMVTLRRQLRALAGGAVAPTTSPDAVAAAAPFPSLASAAPAPVSAHLLGRRSRLLKAPAKNGPPWLGSEPKATDGCNNFNVVGSVVGEATVA